MAAFDYVQNLNDVALKPRLLRSLINEHIPDEKQQLRNSLVLSHIVSSIKTHELLSERHVAQSGDNKKLIEKWKSAVDLWIDRVLMLVSSNMVGFLNAVSDELPRRKFQILGNYGEDFNDWIYQHMGASYISHQEGWN